MHAQPRSRSVVLTRGAVLVVGLALVTAGCAKSDSQGAAAAAGAAKVAITLTNDSCPLPTATIVEGPTTFNVTNTSADAVSELEVKKGDVIMGEKENLAPGLSGSFSLSLAPGDYTTYCPGAKTESTPFTVVAGSASASPTSSRAQAVKAALATATTGYAAYVKDQSAQLTKATTTFVDALKSGDVAAAKAAYGPARVFYERIEPVAESFGDLDPAIDARAGDVPAAQWTGFHPIEKILYTQSTTAGTEALGAKLLADVTKLQTLVQDLTYQPAQLANGATELLDEVAQSKITGEEERYSHLDLLDFQGNVDGSKEAYNLLVPALTLVNPALATTVTTRFNEVDQALQKYKSGSGYVLYGTLTKDDVRSLAVAVDALAEPLSTVAGQIVSA